MKERKNSVRLYKSCLYYASNPVSIKNFSKDSDLSIDLNIVADVASTVLGDKEFHVFMILYEKKCRRVSNLGTEFFNFQQ